MSLSVERDYLKQASLRV